MAIVSSSFVTNGDNITTETFVDSQGVSYVQVYRWDGVSDRAALLAARAAQIESDLAEQEAAALLDNGP